MASPRMIKIVETFFHKESLRFFPIYMDPAHQTFSKSSKLNYKIFWCLFLFTRIFFIPILHSLYSKSTIEPTGNPNLEQESDIFAYTILLVFGILCLVNHYTMIRCMKAWLLILNEGLTLQLLITRKFYHVTPLNNKY